MTLKLSDIPETEHPPAHGHQVRSAALTALVSPLQRRTVLRMMSVSALALGGSVLSWGAKPLARRAAAETGPGTATGWDTCNHPTGGYTPQADTGGAYYGQAGACIGGDYRSSAYCQGTGWHRTDSVAQGPATVNYNRVSNRCWSAYGSNSRNAWRWPTGGFTYRCSDGYFVATASGGSTRYDTVCRAQV